jgi:hypothetical protein
LEETQTKPMKRAKVSEKKTEAHNVSGSAKKDCHRSAITAEEH